MLQYCCHETLEGIASSSLAKLVGLHRYLTYSLFVAVAGKEDAIVTSLSHQQTRPCDYLAALRCLHVFYSDSQHLVELVEIQSIVNTL